MTDLIYLKRLRISECGLDRRAVSSLSENLKQIIELDLRNIYS
jgi:hypothetical protein